VEFREIAFKKMLCHLRELVISAARFRLASEDEIDHLGNDRCFISTKRPIWDVNLNHSIISTGGEATLAPGGSNNSKFGEGDHM